VCVCVCVCVVVVVVDKLYTNVNVAARGFVMFTIINQINIPDQM